MHIAFGRIRRKTSPAAKCSRSYATTGTVRVLTPLLLALFASLLTAAGEVSLPRLSLVLIGWVEQILAKQHTYKHENKSQREPEITIVVKPNAPAIR